MLLGGSGSGKSDLALRLIDRGAVLVADDQCELRAAGDALTCTPPATLAGQMEVRGIGITRRDWHGPVPVRLAVRLAGTYDRMPGQQVEMMAGTGVAAVRLHAFEASAPIKVELALAATLGAR